MRATLPFDDLGGDSSECRQCGRPLSNPTSRSIGIGPVCRGHRNTERTMLKSPKPLFSDTLPPAQQDITVRYENLNNGAEAWCRARRYDLTPHTALIVLTDKSDEHHGTSVTNRVERAAYNAWVALGRPPRVIFAEHYEDDGEMAEHIDQINVARDGYGDPAVFGIALPKGRGYGFKSTGWQAMGEATASADLSGLIDRLKAEL